MTAAMLVRAWELAGSSRHLLKGAELRPGRVCPSRGARGRALLLGFALCCSRSFQEKTVETAASAVPASRPGWSWSPGRGGARGNLPGPRRAGDPLNPPAQAGEGTAAVGGVGMGMYLRFCSARYPKSSDFQHSSAPAFLCSSQNPVVLFRCPRAEFPWKSADDLLGPVGKPSAVLPRGAARGRFHVQAPRWPGWKSKR